MRAHYPNYNEVWYISFFFSSWKEPKYLPEATSGARFRTTLRTHLERSAKGSPSAYCRRWWRNWETWKNSNRRNEEVKRISKDKNVAVFPAIHSIDRSFRSLLTSHSYLALWDSIVDPYLRHRRRHWRAILLWRSLRYVCARLFEFLCRSLIDNYQCLIRLV